jgi:hypothetical protein
MPKVSEVAVRFRPLLLCPVTSLSSGGTGGLSAASFAVLMSGREANEAFLVTVFFDLGLTISIKLIWRGRSF